MRGQYMIFSGPMTHLLSMLYVDKNKNTKTLTCQCEKKTKRHNGFKFRSFVDCFQNGIMAVKGLKGPVKAPELYSNKIGHITRVTE